MTLIAVSQRVVTDPATGERRDALDQRWPRFLAACGFSCLPMPNCPSATAGWLDETRPAGMLLTGGGDIGELGGADPERDEAERIAISWARDLGRPVMGVCRGMQVIQTIFGTALEPVDGHVGGLHDIVANGAARRVNSYHHFGARHSVPELEVWAVANDGVIEAVRHVAEPICGVMWHPERCEPFAAADIDRVRGFFGTATLHV